MKFEMRIVEDTCPDLSLIGEWTDDDGPDTIARDPANVGPGEYRRFRPAVPEHGRQDLERMEAYERGEWRMTGVFAVALDDEGREVARSGGLWGVESQADADYLAEIFAEECAELAATFGPTAYATI